VNCDIKLIQEKTVNQNSDDEWRQERSIRLTASNFGKICRMKDNIGCFFNFTWQ
jgi:hypothetical protein